MRASTSGCELMTVCLPPSSTVSLPPLLALRFTTLPRSSLAPAKAALKLASAGDALPTLASRRSLSAAPTVPPSTERANTSCRLRSTSRRSFTASATSLSLAALNLEPRDRFSSPVFAYTPSAYTFTLASPATRLQRTPDARSCVQEKRETQCSASRSSPVLGSVTVLLRDGTEIAANAARRKGRGSPPRRSCGTTTRTACCIGGVPGERGADCAPACQLRETRSPDACMTTLVPHVHSAAALRLCAGSHRGQAGWSGHLGCVHPAVWRHRRVTLRAARSPVLASLDVDPTQPAGGVSQLLFALADAAAGVAPAPELDAAAKAAEQLANNKSGFLGGIANLLEGLLEGIDSVLSAAHVPYSYGFSIIVLTLLVKAATFPLSKKQIESTSAMQALQPRVKELQVREAAARVWPARTGPCRRGLKKRPGECRLTPPTPRAARQAKYANDQEKLQRETALMYQQAGVNPLAGCLPTLATLPVRHRRASPKLVSCAAA